MIHESVFELCKETREAISIGGGAVEIRDVELLRRTTIDTLAHDAVFGSPAVKRFAQWVIWEVGQALGAQPASIHEFYMARGRGEWSDRTVPAMNIRAATYDSTRAALRAALRTDTAALIFEIARSEMVYTAQPPAEYGASVIAAAIKEGFEGPLFIQGDHFQVNAAKYRTDPDGAIQEVKDLIVEAIDAGYWNIDLDTSTLVTLAPESLADQQEHNFVRSAELTRFVRELEPEGVTISLGGEIGEVGEKNSTPDELHAYMQNYQALLPHGMAGLSKVSVATGTHHGGIVLPDGSMADIALDFETLAVLGDCARQYGCGGAVQHGASTLPRSLFTRFPQVQTLEIHLAQGFTNAMMDHPDFPADLRHEMYRHLDQNNANERKPEMSDLQFYIGTRKKALGAFKAEFWGMDSATKASLYAELEEAFAFYYRELNVTGTRELVNRLVPAAAHHKPMPEVARMYGDDLGLAD